MIFLIGIAIVVVCSSLFGVLARQRLGGIGFMGWLMFAGTLVGFGLMLYSAGNFIYHNFV